VTDTIAIRPGRASPALHPRPCRLAPATPDDLPTVTRLFGSLHAHNAALDPRFALADGWQDLLGVHFARTRETDSALWLLARAGDEDEEDESVGFLVMEAHRDSPLVRHRGWAELVALYVEPSHRGTGLADRLLAEARAWTAARGFDRLQLYVTATNEPARRFYRRAGLRPVQEVWRAEVTPLPGARQPSDPSCQADDARGAELLEPGHHHLAITAREGRADQSRSDNGASPGSERGGIRVQGIEGPVT